MAQSKINELEFPGGGGYQLSSTPSSGRGKLRLFSLTKKTSSLSVPPQPVSPLSLFGDAMKCKLQHLNLLCAHRQVRVAPPAQVWDHPSLAVAALDVDADQHRQRFPPFHRDPPEWGRSIPSTCTTPRRDGHTLSRPISSAQLRITQPQRLEKPSKTTESSHHGHHKTMSPVPHPHLFEHFQGW